MANLTTATTLRIATLDGIHVSDEVFDDADEALSNLSIDRVPAGHYGQVFDPYGYVIAELING